VARAVPTDAEVFSPLPDAPAGIPDDLLATCVHCGFCVPTCPTWDLLREENDSPRGRIYLMRAEAEGRVDAAGAFAVHLDRCLGCRACESVCPAGVPYGRLLERARTRVARRPAARRREDRALAILTDARIAPVVYAAARMLRSTGIARTLGRILPGKAGQLLRLVAATQPVAALAPGPVEEAAGAQAAAPGSAGEDPPTYSLLTGCVMEGLFGHVHAATRRTLAKLGFREVEAPAQACCGALHAHAGRLEEARRLARRNIEAFEEAPADFVITNSAGCGAGLRDYPAWLADEPDWLERAEALVGRVRDVTEVLAAAIEGGDAGASASAGDFHGRVGYDAPCHLHHGQRVIDEPLAVLRSIPGLSVEPLPSSERCCGGAGLYNIGQPELAKRIRAPKLKEVAEGDFDWVATGNPGCIMYLGAGLLRAGDATPVVHPVELLDRAWG